MRATVLIIDDEPNILSALRRTLQNEGFEIIVAASGPEALRILEKTEVAVIVCDYHMPGMKGPEVLAESIKYRPNAVRIALTQYADLKIAEASINKGRISYFMLKPWDNAHMRSVVREAVRNYELEQEVRSLHEVTRRQRDELQQWSRLLERKVLERTEALDAAYEETLLALVLALDSREQASAGHSRRVAIYCLYLALEAGLAPDELEDLYRGALLHDIGKIGVPDAILLKPGKLDPSERKIVEQHVEIGARLLERISYLERSMVIPRYHHEKYNGKGYRQGMAGNEIPVEARIFAVVDVYDALRSDRPYKKSMTHEHACEIIARERGAHFDPWLASVFLETPRAVWEMLATKAENLGRLDRALAVCQRLRIKLPSEEESAAA